MKGKKIFDALTDIDEKYIEESRTSKLKKAPSNWKRWATIAASLVFLISIGGVLIQNKLLPFGGTSGGTGNDGSSTFMSYAGPVFPLTLGQEDSGIKAKRKLTFDFSFAREESIRIWGSDVEDSYILSNSNIEEKRLTGIYPFVGNFNELNDLKPAIVVDEKPIEAKLYPGNDFADSMYLGGQNRTGNGLEISSWEGYKSLLEDGKYLREALETNPIIDQQVIVYTFSDFQSPEEYKAATQAISFNIDPNKTKILHYGFNGEEYGDGGFRRFSYFVPMENTRRDGRKMLIVLGDDIEDFSLEGYKTGACEKSNEVEGVSATIIKSETNLKDLMAVLTEEHLDLYDGDDNEVKVDNEMFLEALSSLIHKHGLFSITSTENNFYGNLEDIISLVKNLDRVFYLEFDLVIPPGENITITASMHKVPNYDYSGIKTANKNVQGYEMVTQLASNLVFHSQTAALESIENIKIVNQNFGFDLEKGIKEVDLDMNMDHYYLEVKPVEP